MCSCCLVSHIRREPEAETKDAAKASEAAAVEQQKQLKTGSRRSGRQDQATGVMCPENSGRIGNIGMEEHDESHMTEAYEILV